MGKEGKGGKGKEGDGKGVKGREGGCRIETGEGGREGGKERDV